MSLRQIWISAVQLLDRTCLHVYRDKATVKLYRSITGQSEECVPNTNKRKQIRLMIIGMVERYTNLHAYANGGHCSIQGLNAT